MDLVTSKDNPRVKRARALQKRRERYRAREFLVEGVRLVDEAISRGAPLVEAFVVPDLAAETRGLELIKALEKAKVPVVYATDQLLAGISQTETPQGVIAVSRFVEIPIPETENPLYLVLDGLRDPGNVGAILRTAQAAGVDAVFFLKKTVDPWSPKVVRSAMGAHFSLPLRVAGSLDRLPPVDELLVAEARGGPAHYQVDWSKSIALAIGGEAFGASDEVKSRATGIVSIPMARETESLNAAAAAAVLLFEAFRQRTPGFTAS